MLHTISKQELIEALSELPEDARLAFASDYGDRTHTQQVHPIKGDVEERQITESAYSDSGFALADEDEEFMEANVHWLYIIS
jgi:hypothetical protein